MSTMRPPTLPLFAACLVALASPISGSIPAASTGPHPIASSCFSATNPSTGAMEDYLIGRTSGGVDRYVAELLTAPDDTLLIQLPVPVDYALYRQQSGETVPVAGYVVYPTRADNTRPNYTFPYYNTADNVFPRMQRAGEAPIFEDPTARYPLIVFSHGYTAHGLWDLDHMKLLASHGYIVCSILHGDGRNSWEGNYGMRLLQVSRFLDYLLAHPQFGPAIDAQRIGISGSSFGGYTTLALLGGGYSSYTGAQPDARFRAGFGFVPYVGPLSGNQFGPGYSNLADVKRPFFAVYGGSDTTVLPATVEAAIQVTGGTTAAVRLEGEEHLLSHNGYTDAFTYELLFFDAWLRDNPESMDQLYGTETVNGGATDKRTYTRIEPLPGPSTDVAFGGAFTTGANSPAIFGWTMDTGDDLRLQVTFPGINEADPSIRYDVMASTDTSEWHCLRSSGNASQAAVEPPFTLPAGYSWKTLETPMPQSASPLFVRIRATGE